MRSFPVRFALFLVVALLLSVLFLRSEKQDVPPARPPVISTDRPSVRQRSTPSAGSRSLSTLPVPTPSKLPEDTLISSLRTKVSDLDRESNGSFLETLDIVLADPAQSIAVASFRIPAYGGNQAMLDTFPDENSSPIVEHRRLVLVYVASAFRGCVSDDDHRHRLEELVVRYPWLVDYLSQQ